MKPTSKSQYAHNSFNSSVDISITASDLDSLPGDAELQRRLRITALTVIFDYYPSVLTTALSLFQCYHIDPSTPQPGQMYSENAKVLAPGSQLLSTFQRLLLRSEQAGFNCHGFVPTLVTAQTSAQMWCIIRLIRALAVHMVTVYNYCAQTVHMVTEPIRAMRVHDDIHIVSAAMHVGAAHVSDFACKDPHVLPVLFHAVIVNKSLL